jgi:hypothetical protein
MNWWELTLRCETCQSELTEPVGFIRLTSAQVAPALFLAAERESLRMLAKYQGCTHLAPLLGEDPPAVQKLTKRELLAGEPPRGA